MFFPNHVCPHLRPRQPTATGKRAADSIGVSGVTGEQGGRDEQSGKSSLVNTADLSEQDANEQLDAASGDVQRREEISGGGLAAQNVNGGAVGKGEGHAPFEATKPLAGANGEQENPPSEPTTAGDITKSGTDQPRTSGLALPPNTEAERYPADLFDVLEAWILEYLRDKLHCGFLLSSHFQEYARFLHVQQRPVTENDFILFRILGRGGFGAVNGAVPSPKITVKQMHQICEAPIYLLHRKRICWCFIFVGFGSP